MFKVYRGGEPLKDPGIDLSDALAQVGIFETMRCYDGVIFMEESHLNRFEESIRTARAENAPKKTIVKKCLRESLKLSGLSNGIVRLTWMEGEVIVLVGESMKRGKGFEGSVHLKTTSQKRSLSNATFPEVKSSAYHDAVLASLDSSKPSPQEWLFLNAEGYVSETRVGNIFAIHRKASSNVLKTPPPAGILNGITRRIVLECASSAGFETEEIPFTRHDLYNANEVILTNSSWEILPVQSLDGRQIGETSPGKVTKKLQTLYRKRVQDYVQKSKNSTRAH